MSTMPTQLYAAFYAQDSILSQVSVKPSTDCYNTHAKSFKNGKNCGDVLCCNEPADICTALHVLSAQRRHFAGHLQQHWAVRPQPSCSWSCCNHSLTALNCTPVPRLALTEAAYLKAQRHKDSSPALLSMLTMCSRLPRNDAFLRDTVAFAGCAILL